VSRNSLKAAIALLPVVERSHHAAEAIPEVVQRRPARTRYHPSPAGDVNDGQAGVAENLLNLFRAAVDELGAKLDGNGRPRIVVRPHAPADPFAALEDNEAYALVMQIAPGGNAGGAGAYDHHILASHVCVIGIRRPSPTRTAL